MNLLRLLRPRRPASPATPPPAEADTLAALIGPASGEVTPRYLKIGEGYASTLIVNGYPAEVGAGWLLPLTGWPGRADVVIHIEPLAPQVAASRLRRQRARLESSRRADAQHGRLDDPGTEAAAATPPSWPTGSPAAQPPVPGRPRTSPCTRPTWTS